MSEDARFKSALGNPAAITEEVLMKALDDARELILNPPKGYLRPVFTKLKNGFEVMIGYEFVSTEEE